MNDRLRTLPADRPGPRGRVGDRPGAAARGPLQPRRGVQRGPPAGRLPDGGPGHRSTSRSPPTRPRSRRSSTRGSPSSTSSSTSRPSAPSARPRTIDPDCPMPYWGMAMANVNNAERAKGLLKVAQEKAEARRDQPPRTPLPRRPRRLLQGGRDVDDKARRQGWLRRPGDDRPGVPRRPRRPRLAGDGHLAERPARTASAAGRRSACSSTRVLAANPLHPGAHHYKIHLWDGHDQTQALESAARLAEASPGIAHAWHMPGHTYTGLKRYADAAYQQEGSARVDHAYMTRDRVMPFHDPQLRPQQPVALREPDQDRPAPRRRSPSPATSSSSPATRRRTPPRTPAPPSATAGAAGPRPSRPSSSGTT